MQASPTQPSSARSPWGAARSISDRAELHLLPAHRLGSAGSAGSPDAFQDPYINLATLCVQGVGQTRATRSNATVELARQGGGLRGLTAPLLPRHPLVPYRGQSQARCPTLAGANLGFKFSRAGLRWPAVAAFILMRDALPRPAPFDPISRDSRLTATLQHGR